jgi:hypothetical protein
MGSTDEGEKNKNEQKRSNLFEAPSNHLTITEVQKDTIKVEITCPLVFFYDEITGRENLIFSFIVKSPRKPVTGRAQLINAKTQ